MDWMPQERERGITISAAATTCLWQQHQINIIDTPGHVDFAIEVERSLRVLDGAIAIFAAVEGVQPQSESVWHQAERYHVPRLAFINKMDRLGSDYRRVLQEMRDKLGASPLLLQLPVGTEDTFRGIVDLITMQSVLWHDEDFGMTPEVGPLPPEMQDLAQLQRDALLEAVAEYDDTLLERYVAGETLEPEQIRTAVRRATLAGAQPGTAARLRNKGIQPLLDAVCSTCTRRCPRHGGDRSWDELSEHMIPKSLWQHLPSRPLIRTTPDLSAFYAGTRTRCHRL
jgi:elongation factor G